MTGADDENEMESKRSQLFRSVLLASTVPEKKSLRAHSFALVFGGEREEREMDPRNEINFRGKSAGSKLSSDTAARRLTN